MSITSGCPSVVIPFRVKVKKAYLETIKSHNEHRRRIPVTQEFIANCLAVESRGMVINHPAKHLFQNALHNSIAKMVTMICSKYSVSCHTDVDDLAQECFLRIVRRIGTFNRKKAKFSTWCWKVCLSTLNSRYRGHLRHASRFADGGCIDKNSMPIEDTSVLKDDIADTIREIARKYPAKTGILFTMFGNPDDADFFLPAKIKLSRVARVAGVKYSDAYQFYKNVVREEFKERFSIDMSCEQH